MFYYYDFHLNEIVVWNGIICLYESIRFLVFQFDNIRTANHEEVQKYLSQEKNAGISSR